MSCVQNRAVRACQAVNAMIHDAGADLEHIISVFAGEFKQDGVAARMLVEVLRHIIHLGAAGSFVADDQVAVLFPVVSRHLGKRESFAHF